MEFKCAVASSSDCPPDKNAIPGIAAGTLLRKHCTVADATSSTLARSFASYPDKTILGFKIISSYCTPCEYNSANTVCNTSSVTTKLSSIS